MSKRLTDVEKLMRKKNHHLERLLFVVAGPSGVGKNTIIKKLLANHPDEMDRIRTYTTRQPREGEVSGVQYHFVSTDEFIALSKAQKLLEADEANPLGHDVYGLGESYSMPADIFENIPPDKHLVVAEVDIAGARRLKERYPECVTIFVTAPPDVLIKRIKERPDETMNHQSLKQRMKTAHDMICAAKEFDYVLYNRQKKLKRTIRAIETIIKAERMRVVEGFDLKDAFADDVWDVPCEHE
nr:hypothetical protein [Anaerolineae bacterium]